MSDTLDYSAFLEKKTFVNLSSGFDVPEELLLEELFPVQRLVTRWALKKGRAAIFADTGLGKTPMQLAWANAVHQYTGNRVLIVAPLGVAKQTAEEESLKFKVPVKYVTEFHQETGIYATNYEHIDKFAEAIRAGFFDGLILDESSILKHQTSKIRAKIIRLARHVPYRLSCTATPSPNDHMELGSQAEFLDIMSSAEMLAMFFTHDSGETSKWRLKGHGATRFWEWLSTWAVCFKKPSDLGFSDDGYELPRLNILEQLIVTGKRLDNNLLFEPACGLAERVVARRITVPERSTGAAEVVNLCSEPTASWIIWCNLNSEQEHLKKAFGERCVSIDGATSPEKKMEYVRRWRAGEVPIMITKIKIFGYGLNWQHCHNMIFVGLNDSWEQLYQGIRRCYRFGQLHPVNVWLISADLEGAVLANIKEKDAKNQHMSAMMVEHMREFSKREVHSTINQKLKYQAETELSMPKWLRKNDEMH